MGRSTLEPIEVAVTCADAAVLDALLRDVMLFEMPSSQGEVPTPASDVSEMDRAARATAGFAGGLYRQIAADHDNLTLSPHSVAVVLAMAEGGARGATRAQLRNVLYGDSDESLPAAFAGLHGGLVRRADGRRLDAEMKSSGEEALAAELRLAATLWLQQGFDISPGFERHCIDGYAARPTGLDFVGDPVGACREVNAWAATATAGHITELVTADLFNVDTRVVLTSAVHLRARWARPFNPDQTTPAPFFLEDGRSTTVAMMHHSQVPKHRYAEGHGWQAVELLYQGFDLALLAVLPAPGAFGDVESGLGAGLLEEVGERLHTRQVELGFPRFKVSTTTRLATPLCQLGAPDAFEAHKADFSGLAAVRLWLSEVVHQALVEVDEEGTVAAGATAGFLEKMSGAAHVSVTFDRPFLFVITDRTTNAVLVLGRVSDPGR